MKIMIDKINTLNEQSGAASVSKTNPLSKRKFHQVLNETIDISSLAPQYNSKTPSITPVNTTSKGFDEMMSIVFKHEGSKLVKDDGGRETSKFGILQGTAKAFGYTGDIANLTKGEAVEIYKKLWDKSGAGALPYPLSLVHFDTYINSPSASRRILKQADGDVDKYLTLREERFKKLAELRPERFSKYLKGWLNRVENLRTLVKEYRESQYLALESNTNSQTTIIKGLRFL